MNRRAFLSLLAFLPLFRGSTGTPCTSALAHVPTTPITLDEINAVLARIYTPERIDALFSRDARFYEYLTSNRPRRWTGPPIVPNFEVR